MSKKTIKQRIALVAVSALTAGLFSVVSTPVANATVPTTATLHLGTAASTTGTGSGTGLVLGEVPDLSTLKSAGLVVASAASVTAAATATGVILPTASLTFAWADATSSTKTSLVVTGGVITTCVNVPSGTTSAAIAISSDQASCFNPVVLASTVIGQAYAVVRPTGAAGSNMTVAAYVGANVSAASPTTGTLLGLFSLTVATSGTAGIPDVAQSAVYIQAPIAKTAAIAGTNAYDSSNTVPNGQAGVAYVLLKDAYKVAVSTTGTVTAAATNGATVKISDTTSTATPFTATASFDSMANSDGVIYYVVNQPVANTAGETTVTFTYAGTVIGVKTFKFLGDVATLTVSSDAITSFVNGVFDATEAALATKAPSARLGVVYIAKDAAGNAVTLAVQPTVSSQTGSMVGATVAAASAAATLQVVQSAAVGYGVTTMFIPATALNGVGTYKLKLTNAAGVEISSATQSVRVSNGGPDSFTGSWDKASYAPGDIAVLTITVRDVFKNLVGFGTPLPGLTAGLLVASGFTPIGGTCVDASYTDSLGVKTCKFAAGNTEGSYSFNLDLDTTTSQSATVGALKIASTTASVSNADVLKSIVALIASINKQIQALQKLILARR